MSAKHHGCGYRLWIESRWNGQQRVPIFIDDDETSPTCGQEVDECPGCGEALLTTGDLCTESDEDEASTPLLERQVLVVLRRLKEEIERETGGLSNDQTLLLADVCRVLGFAEIDVDYVLGLSANLVSAPLPMVLREAA